MQTNSPIDAALLAGERQYLYRYAFTHLRDADLAQDAVQECLVSALQALNHFEGRASLRTWLVTILRSKIVDILRKRAREVSTETLSATEENVAEDAVDTWFNHHGYWDRAHIPGHWSDPESALEQQEFWRIFELCLDNMSARTAQVFMLREVFGESIEIICDTLSITQTNCSVMLYRARMRLRGCLDEKWFQGAR
jgi:RNA polymerase sigma-70 factor (ECF subfamily)